MNDPPDIPSDLEPDAPDELAELGRRLLRDRPEPGDEFVTALRRRLAPTSGDDVDEES